MREPFLIQSGIGLRLVSVFLPNIEKADYENAVNDIRTQNLNYFKKQEDRWVGSMEG